MHGKFIFGWEPLAINGNPLISLCVSAYKRVDPLLCLLYSIKSQTWANWEVIIGHDGPSDEVEKAVASTNDQRIRLCMTETKVGGWHSRRQFMIDSANGTYIGMSNDDNYYCPTYFEWMIHQHQSTKSDFVHCNMVHSHWKWIDFRTQPTKHAIDLGCWTAEAALVKGTPWTDFDSEGDGTYIQSLLTKARKVSSVPGYLFVHN